MAIANLALWDIPASLSCWTTLRAEATVRKAQFLASRITDDELPQWSKAIYTYGMSVCLLEIGDDTQKKEAAKLLEKVPELRQRIAGKSIPLEVRLHRFSRTFYNPSSSRNL